MKTTKTPACNHEWEIVQKKDDEEEGVYTEILRCRHCLDLKQNIIRYKAKNVGFRLFSS